MDFRALNITNLDGEFLCPCCGFPGYAKVPVYSYTSGIIGTTICPCCLWEPGFDDDPNASTDASDDVLESLKLYRKKWARTYQWRGRKELQPSDFEGRLQLEKLLRDAPGLA